MLRNHKDIKLLALCLHRIIRLNLSCSHHGTNCLCLRKVEKGTLTHRLEIFLEILSMNIASISSVFLLTFLRFISSFSRCSWFLESHQEDKRSLSFFFLSTGFIVSISPLSLLASAMSILYCYSVKRASGPFHKAPSSAC